MEMQLSKGRTYGWTDRDAIEQGKDLWMDWRMEMN